MADHYKATIDALADVRVYCDRLDQAYESKKGPHVVAELHHRIRVAGKVAEVHSNLAVAQALTDAAADRAIADPYRIVSNARR